MTDELATFLVEGAAFSDRHEATLGARVATTGGVFWGLLRAIAECPDCPGVFRRPLDDDWGRLGCPQCLNVWVRAG